MITWSYWFSTGDGMGWFHPSFAPQGHLGLSGDTFSFHLLKTCSVQFSHSVMSDSLQPHESQHWYLMGRGQDCCWLPTTNNSHLKELSSPKRQDYWGCATLSGCCSPRYRTRSSDEWGAQLLSLVWLFCDPIAHQVPLSMGFSRQGYWSG